MNINAREPSPANPRGSTVFYRAFHGGFQGFAGEFLRFFRKHKTETDFVVFSVEMSRRNSSTEFLFANTLFRGRHPSRHSPGNGNGNRTHFVFAQLRRNSLTHAWNPPWNACKIKSNTWGCGRGFSTVDRDPVHVLRNSLIPTKFSGPKKAVSNENIRGKPTEIGHGIPSLQNTLMSRYYPPRNVRASRGTGTFSPPQAEFFSVFPSNGTGKRSRLCTAGWERDGKAEG